MTQEFDLIVRNGSVMDGTGAEPFAADVAIKDGVIAVVGPNLEGSAARDVDVRALVPHAAVRVNVMGAGLPPLSPPTTMTSPRCATSRGRRWKPARSASPPAVHCSTSR